MHMIDGEVIDFEIRIRDTWERGKSNMDQEVITGCGLAWALVRILATSDQIDKILFDGKGNTWNPSICERLIWNIREQLGFSRVWGVKSLLKQLGANNFQIEKWQKLIVKKINLRVENIIIAGFHL